MKINYLEMNLIQSSLEARFGSFDVSTLPVAFAELGPGVYERWVELDRPREKCLCFRIVIWQNVQGSALEVKLECFRFVVGRFRVSAVKARHCKNQFTLYDEHRIKVL